MSTINIAIDLDEYIADAALDLGEYGEAPSPLAAYVLHKVTKELTTQIAPEQRKQIIATVEEKFQSSLNAAIDAEVEKRIGAFLQNEIAITDNWARPVFVGTFEDRIAKAFDEKLLAPVDSYGRKLSGCTSSGLTYVDWLITAEVQKAKDKIDSHIAKQQELLGIAIKKDVETKLTQAKESAAAKVLAVLIK